MSYDFSRLHSVLREILCDIDSFCKKNDIQYWLSYGGVLGAVRHGDFIPWDDDLDIVILQEDYSRFAELAQKELGDSYRIECPLLDDSYKAPFIKVKKKNTTFINRQYLNDPDNAQNIFIDVFPLYNIPNGKLSRKKQRMLGIIYNLMIRRENANRGYVNKIITLGTKLFGREKMLKFCYNSFSKYKAEKCNNIECINSSASYGRERLSRDVYCPAVYMDFGNMKVPVPNKTDEYLKLLYGDYMQIPSKEEIEKGVHNVFIDFDNDYTKNKEIIARYAMEDTMK